MMVPTMARARTTLPLESPDCAGQRAHDIELALRRVPGVTRAHVNPATEMAYVEYDRAQCDERHLRRAIADQASTDGVGTERASAEQASTDAASRRVAWRGAAAIGDGVRGAWKRGAWKRQATRLAPLVGVGTAGMVAVIGAGAVFFPHRTTMSRVWELLVVGVDATSAVGFSVGIAEGFIGGWVGAWIGVWVTAMVSAAARGAGRRGGGARHYLHSHS